MAKKGFKFYYDAPVTLTLVILTTIIFLLDSLVLKGKLNSLILSCTLEGPNHSFNGADPLEFVRIFTHALGNSSWTMLLVNSSFLLLCGPTLEERYGSFFVAIMLLVSILVSGVLRQTLGTYQTTGSSCCVFMMILLSSVMAFSKKEIRLSYILIFAAFFAYCLICCRHQIPETTGAKAFFEGNLHNFMDVAAGLCGSLMGFLSAPKVKKDASGKEQETNRGYSFKAKTKENKKTSNKAGETELAEETVIGSIEF